MKGHEYVAHGTLYDGDHLEGSGHSCWNCFRTGIADGSLEIARAQAPESRSREAGLCDLINQNSINCGGAKNRDGSDASERTRRNKQMRGSRAPREPRQRHPQRARAPAERARRRPRPQRSTPGAAS